MISSGFKVLCFCFPISCLCLPSHLFSDFKWWLSTVLSSYILILVDVKTCFFYSIFRASLCSWLTMIGSHTYSWIHPMSRQMQGRHEAHTNHGTEDGLEMREVWLSIDNGEYYKEKKMEMNVRDCFPTPSQRKKKSTNIQKKTINFVFQI